MKQRETPELIQFVNALREVFGLCPIPHSEAFYTPHSVGPPRQQWWPDSWRGDGNRRTPKAKPNT